MSGVTTLARRINLRHATSRPLRSALTLAGISAGVALVFATTVVNASVVESVRTAVRELAGEADLEVAASTPAGINDSIAEQIQSEEGVAATGPVLRSLTTATAPGGDSPILVMGVTPAFLTMLPPGASERVELSGNLGPEGIVVSRTVAAALGASVGDVVELATPSGRRDIAVTGVVSGGDLAAVNGGMVGVMHLPAAQTFFERPGMVDAVYVAVDDGARVADVRDRLDSIVGGTASVGRSEDRVESLTEGYAIIAALLNATGGIALVVALLVVHNTMAMAVADRRRELAVALSLGAGRRQVVTAFVAEGAVLGLVGSAIGIALGLGLAKLLVAEATAVSSELVSIAPRALLTVPARAVALAVAGGVAIAALGAGTAARRVTAVAPVEALRPAAAHEPLATEPAGRRSAMAAAVLLAVGLLSATGAVAFDGLQKPWLFNASLLAWLAGCGLLMPWFTPKAVGWVRPLLQRFGGPVGRLAGDSLLRNPGRTAVAAASLMLTLAMVIALAGPIRSFEGDIRQTLDEVFRAPLYVSAGAGGHHSQGSQPLSLDLQDRIDAVDGVRYVATERQLYLTVDGQFVLAIAEPSREIVRYREAVSELGQDQVAISRLLSRQLDLGTGDTLTLPTPRGEQRFGIAGVFPNWATLPTMSIASESYVRYWGDRTVDEFHVYLDRGADEEQVRQGLQEVVRLGRLDAEVLTKQEIITSQMEPFDALLAMADGTLLIALIIAGLTIANTAFATVLERRWELGIVQTLGMTRRHVARLLLVETGVVGLIGSAGAVVVGTLSAFLIAQAVEQIYALSIPFQPPLTMVAVVVAAGIAIAAAATVLPRRLATRVPLIESLRFE